MNIKHNDPQWGYKKQDSHEISSFGTDKIPSIISNPDSIDAWRHRRMLESCLILTKRYPKSTWVTIGDGNFGSDAYFLKENGCDVLATSLNDLSLHLSKERGYIDQYRPENAENLSFPDESFDFVLCKEAYHHFPRPAIGFYEMLRVAKKALVLIEPHESSPKILDSAKDVFKKLIRNDESTQFEVSGNFIYRINIGEIRKMMTALNYEVMAFKRNSDFFHPALSFHKRSNWSRSFFLTRFGIYLQNLLGKLRLLDYHLAVVIVFKERPPDSLIQELKRSNFKINFLPKNPYLSAH